MVVSVLHKVQCCTESRCELRQVRILSCLSLLIRHDSVVFWWCDVFTSGHRWVCVLCKQWRAASQILLHFIYCRTGADPVAITQPRVRSGELILDREGENILERATCMLVHSNWNPQKILGFFQENCFRFIFLLVLNFGSATFFWFSDELFSIKTKNLQTVPRPMLAV